MAAIQPLPDTGEAAFEHQGRTYTLALNHLAWATAQRAIGLVDGKAMARPDILRRIWNGFDLESYALFYGMLQRHHPAIGSLEQASELMEAAGQPALDAMLLAMGLSAPDPRDSAELSEGTRPQKAQAPKKRTSGRTISDSAPAA